MLTSIYSMPNIRIQTFPLPATRYLFLSFWFSLYVVRCIRAHIYIPSSSPSSIFTLCFLYSLITNFRSFVLFFSFLLVAVVPYHCCKALRLCSERRPSHVLRVSSPLRCVSGDSGPSSHLHLLQPSCRTFQSHERVRTSALRCT